VSTIVLSKTCTATGSITATWWTTYNVICLGSFTVLSNIYKHGFYIDTKTYNATINFGGLVLFMLTSNALIPIGFQLGKTNGTHANSRIHTTNSYSAVNCDIWYGNLYSIGTDRMFGNVWNYSGICNIAGNYADARFGHVAYFDAFNTLTWKGNAYGLLGGITTVVAEQASIDTNIVTPVSVNVVRFYSPGSLYGSVRGNILGVGMVSIHSNIMWINTTLANTNTAVTIFDGTNTVTISVTGAGKSVAVINAEIVTLIKASVLLFQCCEVLGSGIVYFIGLQSISTTATSLVNATTSTHNGGGGLSFIPNILVAGTEINNENLNY